MSIPTKYKYLESINPLPKFIATALKYHGLQEVVGKGSNKTIIEWRDELNQNNTPLSVIPTMTSLGAGYS